MTAPEQPKPAIPPREPEAVLKQHYASSFCASDKHKWTFEKMGGVYQVAIRTSEDLRHIGELDPKVWVALSCPASALEYDQRTLTLIDSDRDGRIRIPEVLEAVDWTCARLKNPADILANPETLPLDAIDVSTADGSHLAGTARAVLRNLGKGGQAFLTQADVETASSHASEQEFNGDGIVPPLTTLPPDVLRFVQDALQVIGGVEDASGRPGINMEIASALLKSLDNVRTWRNTVDAASTPLGKNTADAWALIEELGPKVDDYFLRCELAAYAPENTESLNAGDKAIPVAVEGMLDREALRDLPLSRVESDRPFDLLKGVNPAWREKVERFHDLVKPLLKDEGSLTREDWKHIREVFSPYAGALAGKPAAVAASIAYSPTGSLDDMDDARTDEILDSGVFQKFEQLAKEDADMPAAASDIAEVERLVLYYRHLHRLLRNFISFSDFYSRDPAATFQSGTLYIDGRACHLCMPADKIDAHSALAARSQFFLLYCKCSRGVKTGTTEPAETKNIVASVTAGDSDLLLESRNGVFVDNLGEDWDATVVKVVSNPISISEAVWSPYKKFGNMITGAIGKFASDKQAGLMDSATKKLNDMSATVTSGAPAPAFDVGRNVGIFAAVGIALGAIGTALGSLASAFFAMEWWQFPLIFLGLFLIISGPSVLMAWLKFRQRTLGPLLEASGWAVNSRMEINYSMSGLLTETAALPKNCTLEGGLDAVRVQRMNRKILWIAVAVGALLAVIFISLFMRHRTERRQEAAIRNSRMPSFAELEAAAKETPPGEQGSGFSGALQQLAKVVQNPATTAVPAAAPTPAPAPTPTPAATP